MQINFIIRNNNLYLTQNPTVTITYKCLVAGHCDSTVFYYSSFVASIYVDRKSSTGNIDISKNNIDISKHTVKCFYFIGYTKNYALWPLPQPWPLVMCQDLCQTGKVNGLFLSSFCLQCYTHKWLGWKIHIVDEFSGSLPSTAISTLTLITSMLTAILLGVM